MERWKEHNINGYYDQLLSESDYDGDVDRNVPIRERGPTMASSSPPRLGFIEHRISKLDTLVGIAIKYGVEVADIKKMNGLVTDHQMFALKTLHIPLPGRHPPSPCLSNGSSTTGHGNSDHSPPDHVHRELCESFQSLRMKSSERKVSQAMSCLQGYYGLKPADKNSMSEFFEMRVASSSSETGSLSTNSPMSNRPLSYHRKCRSWVNGIVDEIVEKYDILPVAESREDDSNKWNDKLAQRHQKSEADFTRTPELLLRQDNSSSGGFQSKKGKGLALRPKAASRTALTTDSESSGLTPVPVSLGDAFLTDGPSRVRKSSSTSCLQDQDNNSSVSIWPTFSTAAITKPIFDGLPKPVTSRRNKAALD